MPLLRANSGCNASCACFTKAFKSTVDARNRGTASNFALDHFADPVTSDLSLEDLVRSVELNSVAMNAQLLRVYPLLLSTLSRDMPKLVFRARDKGMPEYKHLPSCYSNMPNMSVSDKSQECLR